nr:MAG TPA: hypothetical protein [Caudoviricetes sp.]
MTASRLQNYQDCSCVYIIILAQSSSDVKHFVAVIKYAEKA